MKNKKGLEMSFAVVFSIIVGAIIIFFAIYTVNKFIRTERYSLDTETAKKLSIIYDPLETGTAYGKTSQVSFRQETRIYTSCSDTGSFGKQKIRLSMSSGLGEKWQDPGGEISIPNKYIFSNKIEQGKKINFVSLEFNPGFKVADLLMMYSKKYCFIGAPNFVVDEVEGLNMKNIELDNCSDNSIKVCFIGEGCDIEVTGVEEGYVKKQGQKVYFIGNLVFAAIFSDPEIYECNIRRLSKKLAYLSLLYRQQSVITSNCDTGLEGELLTLVEIASNLKTSNELNLIEELAKEINEKNSYLGECKLFE